MIIAKFKTSYYMYALLKYSFSTLKIPFSLCYRFYWSTDIHCLRKKQSWSLLISLVVLSFNRLKINATESMLSSTNLFYLMFTISNSKMWLISTFVSNLSFFKVRNFFKEFTLSLCNLISFSNKYSIKFKKSMLKRWYNSVVMSF